MGDVIKFTGMTKLDLDADTVIENIKGKLDGFILAGYDHEGNEFFSMTYSDNRQALWLIERFKMALLDAGEE